MTAGPSSHRRAVQREGGCGGAVCGRLHVAAVGAAEGGAGGQPSESRAAAGIAAIHTAFQAHGAASCTLLEHAQAGQGSAQLTLRPLAQSLPTPGAHGQAVPEAKVHAGAILQESRLGANLGIQAHTHCARRRRANHKAHTQALQRSSAAGAGAAARRARHQQQGGAQQEAWVGEGVRCTAAAAGLAWGIIWIASLAE